MNIRVPPERAIQRTDLVIEVVHDLVCPWCYLGLRRLLRTLRRRTDIAPELIWRPFLLNPDMPRAGMAREDYVLRKFGGEERARRLYASIAEIGRAEGINFRFDRISRTPSSIDAHRLIRWITTHHPTAQHRAITAVEAVFHAHFTDGIDVGDPAALANIAATIGLNRADALAYLQSDTETETVHADNLRAHRLGINGVPCFVIAGKHAIAGAQDAEVIERLLDVARVDAADAGVGG